MAWIVFAVTAACLAVAAALPDEDWPLEAISFLGVALIFASLCGALVASRRPDNAVGWILLAIALSLAGGLFATQYANRTLVDAPGSLPGGLAAAWFQSWLWTPLTGLFPLLVLVFPTGRLPSRRFRPVLWAIIAATVLPAVTIATRPGPFETFPKVANPLGVSAVPGDLLAWLAGGWLVTVPAALLSLFLRFRRARGVERQQIKWFFFAALSAVALVLSLPLIDLLSGGEDLVVLGVSIGFVFPILAFLMLPVAIALAVLRYRLFDIDRIISRTVGYGLVTALLIGLYVVLVVVFQRASRPLTGSSDLAVAVSTLLVAAVFVPLRRRVQTIVDRRFNRARYDAARTIGAFSVRLRGETHIDTLTVELQDLVRRTMQPSHVAVWLREHR